MSTKQVYPKAAKCELDPQFNAMAQPDINQVSYTMEQFQQFMDAGYIQKDLGEWLMDFIKSKSLEAGEIESLSKKNPNIPMIDIALDVFKKSQKSSDEIYLEISNFVRITKILVENKSFFENTHLEANLFDGVDVRKDFGIAHIVTDFLCRWLELLEVKPINTYRNQWKASGSTKTKGGLTLILEYEFRAPSAEDANKHLEEYKKIMMTKGIKTLIACWFLANKHGRKEYAGPLIEILKCMSDKNRKAYFSVKEKADSWNTIKMLSTTNMRVEKFVRKSRKGENITRWVTQPLIEIIGGENEESKADKYPLALAIRLLNSTVLPQDFAPIIYPNTITKLDPSDIFLAFLLHTRSNNYGDRGFNAWDEDYLFKAGNLQKTAKIHKPRARAKLKEKIKKINKAGIGCGAKYEKQRIVIPTKTTTKKSKNT